MHTQSALVVCAGCGQPIYDRYLYNVLDKIWHANCLVCVECRHPLNERCYSRDGQLYCKEDFFRRYPAKCAGCDNAIGFQERVRRAGDKVFHVACFKCQVCQKEMHTGDELYIINGSQFICQADYKISKTGTNCGAGSDFGSEPDDDDLLNDDHSKQLHGELDGSGDGAHLPAVSKKSGDDLDASDDDSSGGQCCTNAASNSSGAQGTKRRGPRTTIKAKQLETLKNAFNQTPKPTRHIREQLARETGLNMRVIQVWFQNRRSKERRMRQLRYGGGFRPSSRRSRNTHSKEDLMPHHPMFPDQVVRPDYYQSNANLGYFSDMFGPVSQDGGLHGGAGDLAALGTVLPPPQCMMSKTQDQDDYMMEEHNAFRPQASPDLSAMTEDYRFSHPFNTLQVLGKLDQPRASGVW